jgi:hypothetical protein
MSVAAGMAVMQTLFDAEVAAVWAEGPSRPGSDRVAARPGEGVGGDGADAGRAGRPPALRGGRAGRRRGGAVSIGDEPVGDLAPVRGGHQDGAGRLLAGICLRWTSRC